MTFSSAGAPEPGPWFVWLGITDKCRLSCSRCRASAEPEGADGTTALADWIGVIDRAAARGARMVQFIGGEPMLHPDLPALIRHSLARKVEVEVYSDLVHIPPAVWDCLTAPGVRVATDFHSDGPVGQGCVTGCDTSARKSANIRRLMAARVRLRVGDVDPRHGRCIGQAVALLSGLGVTDIARVRMRLVGRPTADQTCDPSERCARCGDGVTDVQPDTGGAHHPLPDGSIAAHPLSRWLSVRDLLGQPSSAATGRVGEPVLPAAWARTESRRPPCEPRRTPERARDVTGLGGCRPSANHDPHEDRKPTVGVCAPDVIGEPGAPTDSPAVTVADGEAAGP
jgi:hypothetical protein